MKTVSKKIALVGLAGLGTVCHVAWAVAPPAPSAPAAQTRSEDKVGSTDLGLGAVGDFPKDVTEGFRALLEGDRAGGVSVGTLARPLLGALSARGTMGNLLEQRLKIPGATDSLQIPEAFSVVLWVRIGAEQRSSVLYGFGDPDGDYLVATTDKNGAPLLAFLNEKNASQVDRAETASANLADGRLHAVVAVVNLGSGLARLYVDGRPEAASTISLWRPRRLGFGFATYSLQGRTSVPGIDAAGLLMPRIVGRELTEEEIRQIKPGENGQDPETAGIDKGLGVQLAKDTLVEFWPAQYSYDLRWRPLGGN